MSIRNFARTIILSGIALAGAGAANADVFMKLEGMQGEALQRGFEGQIVLAGASMNISNFVSPDPEGLVDTVRSTNVGPLYLTKSPDRVSPKLMMAAVEGAPLGTVEITFTSPARTGVGQVVESAGSSPVRKCARSTFFRIRPTEACRPKPSRLAIPRCDTNTSRRTRKASAPARWKR